ncbi:MAG TPA: hypothetical protein EYQ26_01755 [Rhodospirillales bacterium]|nr:hypothetical protein [Rhodospirillales bacterium]
MVVPEGSVSSDHPSALLFEERYTCIAWSQNKSVKSPLLIDDYLAASHVVTAFDSERMLAFDEAHLQQHGYQRNKVAILPSFNQLPFLVIGTNNIATIQERLARLFAKNMALKMIPPAIEFPLLRENIQWHRNREHDPANIWMREFFIEIASTL